jgi:hypothetical protein
LRNYFKRCAAGAAFSVAINSSGRCFTWGQVRGVAEGLQHLQQQGLSAGRAQARRTNEFPHMYFSAKHCKPTNVVTALYDSNALAHLSECMHACMHCCDSPHQ